MEGFDFFGLAAKESREPETRELPRRILFRGKLKSGEWASIQYVLTPLFWQRYADQETTLLYLSELGYMTVTYLTDNTAFYFWSTMALRLVTLAYAMERKKPPEPKVWMPDSRQEMRDRIHILMKEV